MFFSFNLPSVPHEQLLSSAPSMMQNTIIRAQSMIFVVCSNRPNSRAMLNMYKMKGIK